MVSSHYDAFAADKLVVLQGEISKENGLIMFPDNALAHSVHLPYNLPYSPHMLTSNYHLFK